MGVAQRPWASIARPSEQLVQDVSCGPEQVRQEPSQAAEHQQNNKKRLFINIMWSSDDMKIATVTWIT